MELERKDAKDVKREYEGYYEYLFPVDLILTYIQSGFTMSA